jgi:excisionase family DNA binding protein
VARLRQTLGGRSGRPLTHSSYTTIGDTTSTPAIATLLERLLTYQEAADRIGVSVRTIRRAVDARELPYVRFGHRPPRIGEDDLIAWVNSRKNK